MKPKRTILCVDDNEQSLSIRKVMLETRGYRVIACNSGEEALERFKKGGVDLVLTDLVMPGVDGSKLIDAIKTLSPQTPAILLSGKVRIYDRDTRADVFLPKGMYAPVELLERIRLLLVRKRGPKRAAVQAHPADSRRCLKRCHPGLYACSYLISAVFASSRLSCDLAVVDRAAFTQVTPQEFVRTNPGRSDADACRAAFV